jgi:hypothetical protein
MAQFTSGNTCHISTAEETSVTSLVRLMTSYASDFKSGKSNLVKFPKSFYQTSYMSRLLVLTLSQSVKPL